MNIYDQIRSNNRATVFIVGAFILFFLFVGLGLDYYYGAGIHLPIFTIAALVFAVFSAYSGWRYGDRFVISSAHARPLDGNDPRQRQWQNVVEEVSIAAGIPVPAIYVIDDPDPNAFATGRCPEKSSVVVTRGLLELLDRDELQGVAAHEMSHIKNFDIRLMLMVAVLVGSLALLSDWALRGLRYRPRRRGEEKGGIIVLFIFVVWLITAVGAPILSQMMAMCVSRRREYLADASGAELTRNPLALASALEKVEGRVGPTSSVNQGTAHLCICDPKGGFFGESEGRLADLLARHPPMRRRVEALKKMAYVN